MTKTFEIKFGTDGWRAVVGKDFNKQNVKLVIQSIARYIFEKYGIEKPVLIGYDPRNKADEYSKSAAEMLSQYGFDVYYSSRIVPTPVLAYCAKNRNACAVMFTASHNPPEYLGIKFIPDYAGPATKEITDKLTENLDREFNKKYRNGSVTNIDFSAEYYKHIEKLIDFDIIKSLDKNIIFDGLYSSSIGYFDKILSKHGIKYDTLHMEHDPNFGGGMPEPKPEYLKELIEKIKTNLNSLGFANDGDADRFGVINENGEYVTPNEIIAILLYHLVKNKHYTGCLVKTVGASLMLDRIAEKLNISVVETPVGFKHVGEAMRLNDCIIGGEESGGLSIKGHIPEKDGLLANLLVLEAIACFEKPLTQLQQELKELIGVEFVNDRIDLRLNNSSEIKSLSDKISQIKSAGGMYVTGIGLKDGIKLYLGKNSWVLARQSGTEPLLRIYFESDSEETLKKLESDILSLRKN
ncbi:MAG: phosphoglucomutase/phosphomannomutase family protein [Candidatus Gastranaerophilales bacterium]|nr:phosphoglucomutase/phosphomannomutase family protein [Candidatus Gastranaerophilales bacterium]